MLVSTPATAALRDGEVLIGSREVVDEFTRVGVIHNSPDRNRQVDRVTAVAGSITALAVASPLSLVFWVEPEMQQSVVVNAGKQHNIPAPAAIAATGSAARDELLSAKRETTVPAIAGFDANNDFVNEHKANKKRDRPLEEIQAAPIRRIRKA
jgi:hypothetical protein